MTEPNHISDLAAADVRDPWRSDPRRPPSLRESQVDALAEHMASHGGGLGIEHSEGLFTVMYDWISEEWRGRRDPDTSRATVKARSEDLVDTLMCVMGQVEQGIEFNRFDAGLADLSDPAIYAEATEYFAGPFCACGDYSCPRSADENARCVNRDDGLVLGDELADDDYAGIDYLDEGDTLRIDRDRDYGLEL